MPLFTINSHNLEPVEQTNFTIEKELQSLIERNIAVVFNSRFVASEFPTGAQHAGRIDTLALSEDNNPVIIEYKKVESSDLINQSLFYLSWIHDHRGDFEIAVQRALGAGAEVDWSDVRVICIAPNYKKYDLHAVQMMGANIELWTYRLFKNSSLYLEEVFRKSYPISTVGGSSDKGAGALTAGQKAAITRATGIYSIEQHLEGVPEKIRDLFLLLDEFITGLDAAIEVSPKKFYITYKISQNIACVEIQKHRLILRLKLNPKKLNNLPGIARDVTDIGHFGTGDLELSIKTSEDFEISKLYIQMAYHKVGG